MTLSLWLLFALALFCLGLYGVLSRRNLIGILIGVELMLNATSINFLALSAHAGGDRVTGQVIVLFIIGLAAAEVAIALSIALAVYRERRAIDVSALEELKG